MTDLLFGLLGFVLALGIFMLGFFVGRKSLSAAVTQTDIEQAEAVQERERLKQDQAAFRVLTGYNADIAYGLAKFSEGDNE